MTAKKLNFTPTLFHYIFGGSAEGKFCHKCDANPPDHAEVIHSLYCKMAMLRKEREAYHKKTDEEGKQITDAIEAIRNRW